MSVPSRPASPGEELAREALAIVLGDDAVRPLRADSPLVLAEADLVALADSVDAAATRRGATCLLADADFGPDGFGVQGPGADRTLATLAAVIDARLVQGTP